MDCAPVISPAAAAPAARQGRTPRGDGSAAGFDDLLGSLSEDRTAAADTRAAHAAAPRPHAAGRSDRRPPSPGEALEASPSSASQAGPATEGRDAAPAVPADPASQEDDTEAPVATEAPTGAWLPVDLMLSVPASGIRLPDPASAEAQPEATPGASDTPGPATWAPASAPALQAGSDIPGDAVDDGAGTGPEPEAKASAPGEGLPGLDSPARNVFAEASRGADAEALEAAGRLPTGIDGLTRPPLAGEPEPKAVPFGETPKQPAPATDGWRLGPAHHPAAAQDVAHRLAAAALTTAGSAPVSAPGDRAAATGGPSAGLSGMVNATEGPAVPTAGTRLLEIKEHAAVAAGEGADPVSELARRFGIELSDAGQDPRAGRDRTPPRGESVATAAILGKAPQAKAGAGTAPPLGAVFADPGLLQGTTVTTSAPVSAAPAAADVEMARQVVRAISLAWRDQVGEARLHLTPEHLGEVTVALRVERGVVSAVLQADTAAARDWIRQHESELRAGLEGQGLQLDSLVVTDEGGRREQQEPPPRSRRPVPRRGANAPTFEVNA